jgi:hypothetical protein
LTSWRLRYVDEDEWQSKPPESTVALATALADQTRPTDLITRQTTVAAAHPPAAGWGQQQ